MGLFTEEDKQGTQANSYFLVGCWLFVANTHKHQICEQSSERSSFFSLSPGLYACVVCAPKALFLSLPLDCISNTFSSAGENKRRDEIGPVQKNQAEILKQAHVDRTESSCWYGFACGEGYQGFLKATRRAYCQYSGILYWEKSRRNLIHLLGVSLRYPCCILLSLRHERC